MAEVATTIETAGAVKPSQPSEKVEPKHIGQRAKEMLQKILPKMRGHPDATLQEIAAFPIQESEQQIPSQPVARAADETSLAEAQQAKTEIAGGRNPASSLKTDGNSTSTENDSLEALFEDQNVFPLDFLKPPSLEAIVEEAKIAEASDNPKLSRIVHWVDRKINETCLFTTKGRRFGLCGIASEALKRAAIRTGMQAEVYQNINVHEKLGIENKDNEAFGHAICVVDCEGKKYLVDLTYIQFVNAATKKIEGNNLPPNKSISDPEVYPIFSQLLKKGYFVLTPDTFKSYLYITSSIPSSELDKKSGEISPDIFSSIEPSPPDNYDDELDSYLD